MTRNHFILGAIFMIGLIILILPDQQPPVMRLNESHGPSWIDMLGLSLITVGWAGLSYGVIKNWKLTYKTIGRSSARLLLALYIISILGIVFAIQTGTEWLLWLAIAIAGSINVLLIFATLHRQFSAR